MELSSSDVKQLYGRILFRIESKEDVQEAAELEQEIETEEREESVQAIEQEKPQKLVKEKNELKQDKEPEKESQLEEAEQPSEKEEPMMQEEKAQPEQQPITEEKPKEQAKVSRFMQGEKVQWKLKPNSHLGLILLEEEFGNRTLTNLLKHHLVKSGIDLKRIGFGVVSEPAEEWDFSEMEIPAALVFHKVNLEAKQPFMLGDKQLFFAFELKEVAQDARKAEYLQRMLKGLKKHLGM